MVDCDAPRGDHRAMTALARELHASGLGPREVLAACYGVPSTARCSNTPRHRAALEHTEAPRRALDG